MTEHTTDEDTMANPGEARDAKTVEDAETPVSSAPSPATFHTESVRAGSRTDNGPGTAVHSGILEGVDGLPIPDEIREAGRSVPDQWLDMVDPAWSGEGEPPKWASVGRWRTGLDGEIEEWQDNPEYRPSPRALGWPEPEDDVDKAIQLAATGYGPGEAVPRALADREVAVLASPGGGPLATVTPGGDPAVPLFTSLVHLHTAGRFGFELISAVELLDRLPEGHLLHLNPSAPVSMMLEPDALREAAEARTDVPDKVAPQTDSDIPAAPRPGTSGSDTPGGGPAIDE
ncbi:type VII secretion system-associated protein [Streptomyces sp. NPDC087844]|uniref:type VII secretion system-associated protein n=1 Tax=Streptomyces sp. NPDC087844 TaxID=3365805 RepID=UPI00381EF6FA